MATPLRLQLMRWHIWLGWLAGVPILLWMVSGLFMVAQPIEKIRGMHLRAEIPAVSLGGVEPVVPRIDSAVRAVEKVTLEQRPGGPIWLIRYADGGGRRASVETGAYLAPQLSGDEAARIARAAYTGDGAFGGVTRIAADANPLELRHDRPAWRATFGSGTHVYVDAETGDVLALRTGLWRAFDLMWGLHIMDLGGREDTSHPILIVAAILSLLMVLLGAIILPWRYIRKNRRQRAKR